MVDGMTVRLLFESNTQQIWLSLFFQRLFNDQTWCFVATQRSFSSTDSATKSFAAFPSPNMIFSYALPSCFVPKSNHTLIIVLLKVSFKVSAHTVQMYRICGLQNSTMPTFSLVIGTFLGVDGILLNLYPVSGPFIKSELFQISNQIFYTWFSTFQCVEIEVKLLIWYAKKTSPVCNMPLSTG